MTGLLYHGTRNLARVLDSDMLLAHGTDDGHEAVSFSRCPRVAAQFGAHPAGGVLVFDRTALRARVRLVGYHMNCMGFTLRSEGHTEHEERALCAIPRISTALVWWYDRASIPADWRRARAMPPVADDDAFAEGPFPDSPFPLAA